MFLAKSQEHNKKESLLSPLIRMSALHVIQYFSTDFFHCSKLTFGSGLPQDQ